MGPAYGSVAEGAGSIARPGRQRFGGADVSAERRLADLESSLAQVKLDPTENASLLAPLLDIPLPKERAPILGSEELRREANWFCRATLPKFLPAKQRKEDG